MTNSVDLDQTAPIGAVCSGSTLFASILKLVSNVRQLFAAEDFIRQHFQMNFFLGALRVKSSPFKDGDSPHTHLYLHKQNSIISTTYDKTLMINTYSCMGIRYAKVFEAAKSMFKS